MLFLQPAATAAAAIIGADYSFSEDAKTLLMRASSHQMVTASAGSFNGDCTTFFGYVRVVSVLARLLLESEDISNI